jgi:hypothetical protein
VRFLPIAAARLHLFRGRDMHPDQPVCDTIPTHLTDLIIRPGRVMLAQRSPVR